MEFIFTGQFFLGIFGAIVAVMVIRHSEYLSDTLEENSETALQMGLIMDKIGADFRNLFRGLYA